MLSEKFFDLCHLGHFNKQLEDDIWIYLTESRSSEMDAYVMVMLQFSSQLLKPVKTVRL